MKKSEIKDLLLDQLLVYLINDFGDYYNLDCMLEDNNLEYEDIQEVCDDFIEEVAELLVETIH